MTTTTRYLALALALAVLAAPARGDDLPRGRWTSLFNGEDLDGWVPKIKGYDAGVNHADTFRVEDGAIKVSYDKYDKFDSKFGHLFTKQKFSNYRLRIEYRFVGDQCPAGPSWAIRNSGVMVHGQAVESMRKDQDFPVSIEVQFLGGNGKDERTTGNLCTPGTNVVMDGQLLTRHCTNSKSKTYHGDRWVTAEVEVHGAGKIRHFIDGELVLEYEQPQYDPNDADGRRLQGDGPLLIREGTISLQSESHPIEFRKVEIMPLDE
jgi:hypothetical protein